MNRQKYIKTFCKKLELLWLENETMRFYQLLYNFTELGTESEYIGLIPDPFHYQDDLIAGQINENIDECK